MLSPLDVQFRSNTRAPRIVKCSSVTICNHGEHHTNSWVSLEPPTGTQRGGRKMGAWHHQEVILDFAIWKEGLDKLINFSLSFLLPKCFGYLDLPHSKAVPISDVSSGTAHKPGWHLVRSFVPEGHRVRKAQQGFREPRDQYSSSG